MPFVYLDLYAFAGRAGEPEDSNDASRYIFI